GAERMRHLPVIARQVEVGEREVDGVFLPDLDARQPIEVELQARELVLGVWATPGLPVDDLPGTVGVAVHGVDATAHDAALDREKERPLGEQRRSLGETARQERLP